MKRKLYAVIAGIVGCGILAGIVVAALGRDDIGPEINISEDCTIEYDENLKINDLLPYISVVDEKDGDVSDSLIIESVSIAEFDKTAKVYLVAVDKSYNVTRIAYEMPVKDSYFEGKDSDIENLEQNQEEIGSNSESNSQDKDTENNEDNNTTVPENNEQDDTTSNNEEPEQPKPDMAAIVEQEIAALPADYPQIRLNTYEVTLERGQSFRYSSYIDSIVDREDSRDYLYGHIQLLNSIDNSKPGEYPVSYYVIDSDGNQSNIAVLKVTIS